MVKKAEDRAVVYALAFPAACLIYVGSTKNFGIRKSNHLSDLRHGRHSNRRVQKLFDQREPIEFVVLERVEENERKAKEQEWLDALFEAVPKTALNFSPSASDSTGVRFTVEAKAKMSKAQKGRVVGDDAREKNRLAALRRWKDPKMRNRYVKSAAKRTSDRERDEGGRFI
jgi:predicted GIY-YIG superfamily endonuclease